MFTFFRVIINHKHSPRRRDFIWSFTHTWILPKLFYPDKTNLLWNSFPWNACLTVTISALFTRRQRQSSCLIHKSWPSGFVRSDKLLVNSALWPQAPTSGGAIPVNLSEVKARCRFSCHACLGDVTPPPCTHAEMFIFKWNQLSKHCSWLFWLSLLGQWTFYLLKNRDEYAQYLHFLFSLQEFWVQLWKGLICPVRTSQSVHAWQWSVGRLPATWQWVHHLSSWNISFKMINKYGIPSTFSWTFHTFVRHFWVKAVRPCVCVCVSESVSFAFHVMPVIRFY